MELTGTQTLPVTQQIAWDALNDPEILKASITGCEQLDRTSETEFSAAVTAAIGPVKARFKAKLTLSDIDAPNSYKIRFDGQGGAAGFGKGEAKVALTAEGAATRLDYTAQANVGGKLAQIGSRLVDAASRKLADEFFTKFNAELKRRYAPAEVAPVVALDAVPPAGPHAGDLSTGGLVGVLAILLAVVAAVAAFLSKG